MNPRQENKIESIAENVGDAFQEEFDAEFHVPEHSSASVQEMRLKLQKRVHELLEEFFKKTGPCPHCGRE